MSKFWGSHQLPVSIPLTGACAVKEGTLRSSVLIDAEVGGTHTVSVHPADEKGSVAAIIAEVLTIPDSRATAFSVAANLWAPEPA